MSDLWGTKRHTQLPCTSVCVFKVAPMGGATGPVAGSEPGWPGDRQAL